MNRRGFLSGVGLLAGGGIFLSRKTEASSRKGLSHEEMVLLIVSYGHTVFLDGTENKELLGVCQLASGNSYPICGHISPNTASKYGYRMKIIGCKRDEIVVEYSIDNCSLKTERFDLSNPKVKIIKFLEEDNIFTARCYARQGERWIEL